MLGFPKCLWIFDCLLILMCENTSLLLGSFQSRHRGTFCMAFEYGLDVLPNRLQPFMYGSFLCLLIFQLSEAMSCLVGPNTFTICFNQEVNTKHIYCWTQVRVRERSQNSMLAHVHFLICIQVCLSYGPSFIFICFFSCLCIFVNFSLSLFLGFWIHTRISNNLHWTNF